jgi:1-acyl-sn-glycerol-3-phosphate acyltransferase
MIRTIIWFIYFVLHLIYTLPFLCYAKYLDVRGKIEKRDKVAVRTARTWARCLVTLSGGKVTVIGMENIPTDREVVFIGNHKAILIYHFYLVM